MQKKKLCCTGAGTGNIRKKHEGGVAHSACSHATPHVGMPWKMSCNDKLSWHRCDRKLATRASSTRSPEPSSAGGRMRPSTVRTNAQTRCVGVACPSTAPRQRVRWREALELSRGGGSGAGAHCGQVDSRMGNHGTDDARFSSEVRTGMTAACWLGCRRTAVSVQRAVRCAASRSGAARPQMARMSCVAAAIESPAAAADRWLRGCRAGRPRRAGHCGWNSAAHSESSSTRGRSRLMLTPLSTM